MVELSLGVSSLGVKMNPLGIEGLLFGLSMKLLEEKSPLPTVGGSFHLVVEPSL